jgi:hypothetical protein
LEEIRKQHAIDELLDQNSVNLGESDKEVELRKKLDQEKQR